MQSNANGRASLLSGLRTGGVRSTSQPMVPHTAAVGGSFNVPRLSSYSQQQMHYPDEDVDELADMVDYGMHLNGHAQGHRMMPATAGPLDGTSNRFQQQQQAAFLQQMAAQRTAANGMNGMGIPGLGAVDPMQMQLMQLELMKLQALQQAQQQYQIELMAQQNQRQQQQQQQQSQRTPSRRQSLYGEPATAAPGQTSFDLRGTAQFARNQGDGFGHDLDGPKTAALGGKFGGRPVLSALNPNATVFTMNGPDEPLTPKTAIPGNSRTTVISGGTSLGGISTAAHATAAAAPVTPSKSDSAMSWRRPSAAANSPMTPVTPTRSTSMGSPAIRLTPSFDDSVAPSPLRQRPSPLRFEGAGAHFHAEPEGEFGSDVEAYASDMAQLAVSASTSDVDRDSSPGTPPSAGSSNSLTREEASKRLYEGLGVGRPVQIQVPPVHVPVKQQVTQVLRQPRGPPASVDELGPRNFAARMQKKLVMAA